MGQQKGHLWRPVDFISELENECEKFSAVRAGDRAWVAALCTKHPGGGAWSTAIDKFNHDYAPRQLLVLDDPKNYPDSYFLDVLQVRGLEVSRGAAQEGGRRSRQ
jgi:hypothetical protein